MNMFKTTSATSPQDYLAMVPDTKRQEIQTIHQLILSTLPSLTPRIVSGMIGYGTYHYRYPSGREGDWSLVLLASQKNYISLYICAVTEKGIYIAESYKDQLPKASIGKSCIRFKSVQDIDLHVLKEILTKAEKLGGMGQVN